MKDEKDPDSEYVPEDSEHCLLYSYGVLPPQGTPGQLAGGGGPSSEGGGGEDGGRDGRREAGSQPPHAHPGREEIPRDVSLPRREAK